MGGSGLRGDPIQRKSVYVRKQRSTPTCSDLNIADRGMTIWFGTVQAAG